MTTRSKLPPGIPDSTLTLATIGPVARSSVVDAVADKLRGEILAGRLAPGTRLPSERELSLALGVNRLTLRASLARLEALGLITTRHGAGTVVASWRERAGFETLNLLLAQLQPDDPTWKELMLSILETRRVLATEAIALAAERRTEEDLEAIESAARDLEAHVDDPVAYARVDVVFMRAVVRAAKNLGLELFLNTFAKWPDEQPQLVHALYDNCKESVAIYQVVTHMIRNGNPNVARRLVRKGLDEMDRAWAARHAAKHDERGKRKKKP
jgi:GntR family transcriptional repressor for pyruvate dehydrogenase complex